MNIITEIEILQKNGWKIELNATQLRQLKNLKINKNTFNVFKANDETIKPDNIKILIINPPSEMNNLNEIKKDGVLLLNSSLTNSEDEKIWFPFMVQIILNII